MNVIILGATGMVGQGALRAALNAPDVAHVYTVGRSATGQKHPRLVELVHDDFTDFHALASTLPKLDACFYCLGVSSAGMDEAAYTRVTYDYALAAGRALAQRSPELVFVFVSGQGTDSSEQGRVMWARVKGRTENALLKLFPRAVAFRPGVIQPLHGAVSKTPAYRWAYLLIGVFIPLLRKLFPRSITTTEELGLAMLNAARGHAPARVLEARDIIALAHAH